MHRYTKRTGALEILMIFLCALYLFPIYVMINLSIRSPTDVSPAHAPTKEPTLDNFLRAWSESNIGRALINSAFITTISTLAVIFIGAAAAYGLVKLSSRFGSIAFFGFLIGLLVPFQLTMIPMYQNFNRLGFIGSPIPLIILYIGFRMPFTIFLYATFLRQLAPDYEEAAEIDGAGPFRRFFQVMFPLLKPVTGTVAILTALHVWNDFLAPLLYVGGTKYSTVPMEIYKFVGDLSAQWPLVFSALIIASLPIIIFFFFLQKRLMHGFSGGLKG